MVIQSVFMLANSPSTSFYHSGSKVKNLMLLNHFSLRIVYVAIKQSCEGIWEENYRSCRTSRSQSAAPSDGGMQDRAVRQET